MKNNKIIRMLIKRKIRHPYTKKLVNDIYIRGKGIYRWNNVYHTYNSLKNNELLYSTDMKTISWNSSK